MNGLRFEPPIVSSQRNLLLLLLFTLKTNETLLCHCHKTYKVIGIRDIGYANLISLKLIWDDSTMLIRRSNLL